MNQNIAKLGKIQVQGKIIRDTYHKFVLQTADRRLWEITPIANPSSIPSYFADCEAERCKVIVHGRFFQNTFHVERLEKC